MLEFLTAMLADPGPTVTFIDEEISTQLQPHNDALVVVAGIDHIPTHRVLVDRGSLANVHSLAVLRALGWDVTKLKRCQANGSTPKVASSYP